MLHGLVHWQPKVLFLFSEWISVSYIIFTCEITPPLILYPRVVVSALRGSSLGVLVIVSSQPTQRPQAPSSYLDAIHPHTSSLDPLIGYFEAAFRRFQARQHYIAPRTHRTHIPIQTYDKLFPPSVPYDHAAVCLHWLYGCQINLPGTRQTNRLVVFAMSRTLIIIICCLVHCFGYATARTGPLGPMNNVSV